MSTPFALDRTHTMFRTLGAALGLAALFGQAVGAAALAGRVDTRTADGVTASPAVVYAEPLDRSAPARPAKVTLGQKDKTFMPGMIAVPVGSTVDFPNQDPIFHNVFSLSAPSPFDLGLYRAGSSRARTFEQPGTYRVFCNIHPRMSAAIVVVPTPYVTVTDADGGYALDLPPGKYRITARSDRSTPVTVEVTVGAGAMTAPALALDESQYVSVPHRNKFGQEYPPSAYDKKGGR